MAVSPARRILWCTGMVFVILPHFSLGSLSDYKICGDSECQSLISRVQATRDHHAEDCRFLSFRRGDTIFVYHKLAGKRGDLWAGSIDKQFGYFPKEAVQEEQVYAATEKVLATQKSDFFCMDEFGYPIDSSHLDGDADGDQKKQESETAHTTPYPDGTSAESPPTSEEPSAESPVAAPEAGVASEEEDESKSAGDAAAGTPEGSRETPAARMEQGGSDPSPSSWLGSSVTGWLGLAKEEDAAEITETRAEASVASSVTGWLGFGGEGKPDDAEKGTEEDTDSANSLASTMTGWLGFGGGTEKTSEKEQDEEREDGEEQAERFRSRRMTLDLEGSQLHKEERKETGTLDWLGNGLSSTLGFGWTNQEAGHEATPEGEETTQEEEEQPASGSWLDMGIGDILGFGKDKKEVEESAGSGLKGTEEDTTFEHPTGSENVDTSRSQSALTEEVEIETANASKVEETPKDQNVPPEIRVHPETNYNGKGASESSKDRVSPEDAAAEVNLEDIPLQTEVETTSKTDGGMPSMLNSSKEEEEDGASDDRKKSAEMKGKYHQMPKSIESEAEVNNREGGGDESKTVSGKDQDFVSDEPLPAHSVETNIDGSDSLAMIDSTETETPQGEIRQDGEAGEGSSRSTNKSTDCTEKASEDRRTFSTSESTTPMENSADQDSVSQGVGDSHELKETVQETQRHSDENNQPVQTETIEFGKYILNESGLKSATDSGRETQTEEVGSKEAGKQEEIERLKGEGKWQDVKEIKKEEKQEVEEIKEVGKQEEVEEIKEVWKHEEVEEIKEEGNQEEVEAIKEVGKHEEVEEIKEVGKHEELEEIKEVGKHEEVEEIKEVEKQEEVEEIKKVEEQEERKEIKEEGKQEEKKEIKEEGKQEEVEEIKEVEKQEEMEEIKEVWKQEEVEEIKEVEKQEEVEEIKEEGKQEEVEEIKEVEKQEEVEEIKEEGKQEEVEEIKEEGKQEEVEEIKEVGKHEEVEAIKEVGKHEEVEEIKEVGKHEEVEEIKEVGKHEEVEEIKEVEKQEEVEEIKKVEKQEERKEIKEEGKQEEKKEIKEEGKQEEVEEIKEVEKQERLKGEGKRQDVKEIKKEEKQEVEEIKEVGKQEEVEEIKEVWKQEEVEEIKEVEKQEEVEEIKEVEKQEEVEEIKEEGKQEEVEEIKEEGKQEEVEEIKEERKQEEVEEIKEEGKQEEVEEIKEEGKQEEGKEIKEERKQEEVEEIKEEGKQEDGKEIKEEGKQEEMEEIKEEGKPEEGKEIKEEGKQEEVEEIKEVEEQEEGNEIKEERKQQEFKEEKQAEGEELKGAELKEVEGVKEQDTKEDEEKQAEPHFEEEMENSLHSLPHAKKDKNSLEPESDGKETQDENSSSTRTEESRTEDPPMEEEEREEEKVRGEVKEEEVELLRRSKGEEGTLTCSNDLCPQASKDRVVKDGDGNDPENMLSSIEEGAVETGKQNPMADNYQILPDRVGASQPVPAEGEEKDEDGVLVEEEKEEKRDSDESADPLALGQTTENTEDEQLHSREAHNTELGDSETISTEVTAEKETELESPAVTSEQSAPSDGHNPGPGAPGSNGAFGLFKNAFNFFGSPITETEGSKESSPGLGSDAGDTSAVQASLPPERALDVTTASGQVYMQDLHTSPPVAETRTSPPTPTGGRSHPTESPLQTKTLAPHYKNLLAHMSADEATVLLELFGRHKLQFLDYVLGSKGPTTGDPDNDGSILLDIERLLGHHREALMAPSARLADAPREVKEKTRALIALQKLEVLLARVRETFSTAGASCVGGSCSTHGEGEEDSSEGLDRTNTPGDEWMRVGEEKDGRLSGGTAKERVTEDQERKEEGKSSEGERMPPESASPQPLEGVMRQTLDFAHQIAEDSSTHVHAARERLTWLTVQVVASLPDDIRPGPDLYGVPWEPVIFSSLVGLVTMLLFTCRCYSSVKSRIYRSKERRMAEQVAELLDEKCKVLETLSKCQQEYDGLESTLRDNGVLAQTQKSDHLEVKARQLEHAKRKMDGDLEQLKDQLDQQREFRLEQERRLALLEESMKTTEEETRELQSQEEQAQTTLKVYSMNSDRLQRNLETAGEENALLQESNAQLRQQVEGWAERVNELEADMSRCEVAHSAMLQDVANKDERLTSLTDRLLRMKAWDSDLEEEGCEEGGEKETSNGKGNVTDALGHLQKVQKLIYAAKLNADLKSVDEDKDRLFAKLNDEVKAKEDLQVRIKELDNEKLSLQSDSEQYQDQVQRLQQKLQIMTEMYQENELKLHRLLTVEEKERTQKEEKLNKADKNIALAMEELGNYRQRAGEMEEELEKTKQSYQTQISAHEKKAHNNWLAARAADRDLTDIRRENALFRQKLTDTQFKLDALDKDPYALDSLARPLPFRAERSPYGPSPLGRPASETRPFLSPPTLMDGPPARLSPRVTRGPVEPPGGQGELEQSGGPHSDSGSISPTWERDRRGPPPGPPVPPGPLGPPGYMFPEPGGPMYRRPPPGPLGPLPPFGPLHPRGLPPGAPHPADMADGSYRENSHGPGDLDHRESGPGDRRTPPEADPRIGGGPPMGPMGGPPMGPLSGPFPRRAPYGLPPHDFYAPRGPAGPPMMPMWAPPPPGMMLPPRFPPGGPLGPRPHYAPLMRPPLLDGPPHPSMGPLPPRQSGPSPPHSQSPEEHTASPEDAI